MKLHFLWRENYIGYLWASNVTAKAYFLHSGILFYENEILSAYATSRELKAINEFTKYIIKNPEKILELENKFENIRKEIKVFEALILKKSIKNVSNEDLYDLFAKLIDILRRYINNYRLTDPYYLEKIERMIFKFIKEKIPKEESAEKVVAEFLSNGNKKLYLKYDIDFQLAEKLNLLNAISKMRFNAKKVDNYIVELSEKLLREISRKTYFAVSQISFFEMFELKDLLIKGKEPNLESVNRRQKKYAIKVDLSNPIGLEKISANKIEKIIQSNYSKESEDSFGGLVVYPGSVTGSVKIVPPMSSIEEYSRYIKTLKKTDVLVASMTAPNLTPAFLKVAAVITDEGGLMSHAALVAREEKVPCIVGTKIATRILKNGDIVTVDAINGIINKHV